jgi:hypothetical protein
MLPGPPGLANAVPGGDRAVECLHLIADDARDRLYRLRLCAGHARRGVQLALADMTLEPRPNGALVAVRASRGNNPPVALVIRIAAKQRFDLRTQPLECRLLVRAAVPILIVRERWRAEGQRHDDQVAGVHEVVGHTQR